MRTAARRRVGSARCRTTPCWASSGASGCASPVALWSSLGLTLVAVGLDLCIPWASGRLVDAVAHPAAGQGAAWRAWGGFVGLYLAFCVARNSFGWVWNPFAAAQHGGDDQRRLRSGCRPSPPTGTPTPSPAPRCGGSAAPCGAMTSSSDALLICIVPSVLVLVGLSLSMMLRWPLVGAVLRSAICALYHRPERAARPPTMCGRPTSPPTRWTRRSAPPWPTPSPPTPWSRASAPRAARAPGWPTYWRRGATAVTRTWNRFQMVWLLQNLLLAALQAGLSGLMLWQWMQARATPGDVAFAISAFMLMAGYLRNMGENVRQLQKGLDDALDVAALHADPAAGGGPADAAIAPAARRGAVGPGGVRPGHLRLRQPGRGRSTATSRW